MSRELLKRAAVVLREIWDNDDCNCETSVYTLRKEIETYLTQPEPEPVAFVSATSSERKPLTDEELDTKQKPIAYITGWYGGYQTINVIDGAVLPNGTPLYAAPPERKPLSDINIITKIIMTWHDDEEIDLVEFAHAIEAAHGITS